MENQASPRPLFYFGKPKNLKQSRLYFFFLTQFLLMDKVIKNKRGLELMTSPPFQVINQVQKNLFISHILSDQV